MRRWRHSCLSPPASASHPPPPSPPMSPAPRPKALLSLHHHAVLAILALSLLCFWPSLRGAFVFDDAEAIVNNPDVRGRTSLAHLWGSDFWGRQIRSARSHKSYRPLTVLSFRLDWWLWGGDTVGFHAVNIGLHAAVSLLSLRLFSVLAEDCGLQDPRLPSLAALLFALHPVHTECVGNIVGRAELLSGLLFIAAFLAYRECRSPLLVIALAAASMLCKEQGVTVLGVCFGYELLIRNGLSVRDVLVGYAQRAADRANNNDHKSSLWSDDLLALVRRLAWLVVGACVLVLARLWVVDFTPPVFSPPDNPASFHTSPIVRGVNYVYVYILNGWLLLAPSQLCFDYSMGCIPLITTLKDPRLLIVIAASALLLLATNAHLRMEDCPMKRLVSVSGLLLVIPFLPASNVVVRVGFVLAERVLYLPSLGYSLLVAAALLRLPRHRDSAILPILLLFAAKSHMRSGEWMSEVGLFSSGARVCPLNAKVHYNLGKVLGDSGLTTAAAAEYRTALQLEPSYEQAMNNLANLLKDTGSLQEARDLLTRATIVRPQFAAAWMNLGIVEASLGAHAAAEAAYARALRERAVYPDCLFNLGNLYLETGRKWAALAAWHNATTLSPTHAKAWINQVVLLDAEEQWAEAVSVGQAGVKHLPDECGLRFSLGSALGKLGRLEEAEAELLAAIRLSPLPQASHAANLGKR